MEHFNLGDMIYIEGRFGVEECEVLGKMDEVYSVKHSYYTFDVHESKMFKTKEEVIEQYEKNLEIDTNMYLEKMETKEEFSKYCIIEAYREALDPEYPSFALAKAIEKRFKEYFNEDINNY